MPRLRQVPRSEASPEAVQAYDRLFGDRDPVAQPGTATGTPGNWWTVFALVPDILGHAQSGFAVLNSRRRVLKPYYREFGITRAGFLTGSQFVFSQHSKASRAAGISEEKLAAIPAWASASVFTPDERAILAYTDELVLQDGRVQDGTFEALRSVAGLNDEAILELTYAVSMYRLHAAMCRALRLEYDDIDERVVEIAAPEGEAAADIMTTIAREPSA
jgi:alkylhydroperoxidase family enzyme